MTSKKKFVSKDDIHFRWKRLTISPVEECASGELSVSNEVCPLPDGLALFNGVLSGDEAVELNKELLSLDFTREGFEQRRRVQRYSVDGGGPVLPDTLKSLIHRVFILTGLQARQVSVEEYSSLQTLKFTQYGSNGYNGLLTGFESVEKCQCHAQESLDAGSKPGKCGCFVAQIPLRGSAVKHLNKPARRHPSCFDLESPQHWTDIRVDANSMLLQSGDGLWNWRSRVSALPPSPESDTQDTSFIILKLCSLPTLSASTGAGNPNISAESIDFDSFGFMGSPETSYCTTKMPPMEDILTIIVTTSPIKSNPSTELLETTFHTFLQAGPEFAFKCRKVIVCDGFRRVEDGDDNVTQRHRNAKQAMRNGIVTDTQAEDYARFKANLRKLCADANSDSTFQNARVEELDERQGYGFALRHALRICVSTPYVCVIQHDRTFMRPTPIAETMRAMWHHRYIKYVTISMRSNLMYRDLFMGKYGKTYFQDFDDMILRLPELNLDKEMYGPDGESAKNMTYTTPKVMESIQGYLQKYTVSNQALGQQEWLRKHPNEPGRHQLTLTPTLFWYDNVHIAETAHYRDFVFNPTYKMVKKGGFVEDKLSPMLTRTLEKLGMKQGHARFGCYILDDHSGLFFTGHLDGGSYMTQAKQMELEKNERSKQVARGGD